MKQIYVAFCVFVLNCFSIVNLYAQGNETFSGLTVTNNGYATRTFNGSSGTGYDPGADGVWTANRAQANQQSSPLIISTRNGTAGNIVLPALTNGVGEMKIVFARRYSANNVQAQGQLFWSPVVSTPVWTAIPGTFTIPSAQDQLDSTVIAVNLNGPILIKLENITDPGDNNNSRIGIQSMVWSSFGTSLPVVLSQFFAEKKAGQNVLKWQTTFEKNVRHFEVESSEDAKHFSTIGIVNASNTAHGQAYSFADNFQQRATMYRLKIVDFDAKFDYSKTIQVSGHNDIEVFLKGNMVRNNLTVSFKQTPQNVAVQIWSINGVKVWSGQANSKEMLIDISHLAQGQYWLHIGLPNEQSRFRFVKL